jgi:hypothetical protein
MSIFNKDKKQLAFHFRKKSIEKSVARQDAWRIELRAIIKVTLNFPGHAITPT